MKYLDLKCLIPDFIQCSISTGTIRLAATEAIRIATTLHLRVRFTFNDKPLAVKEGDTVEQILRLYWLTFKPQ